jgi:hypothetical protein
MLRLVLAVERDRSTGLIERDDACTSH